MSKFVCKLFGVPQITKDGQNFFFPYGKINALLYYLFVVKVASRDEIAGLLWPDADGATAKKNIRNAIYQAKKSVGQDIIIASQKSFLILNQELELELDVDQFEAEPSSNLALYRGDFLQGFFLKDAAPYEYWVSGMRDKFAKLFSTECYKKVENGIRTRQYDGLEPLLDQLISMDEFDERNYRLLMRFYMETGRNSKVIETYFDLVKRLRHELGIEPERETTEIYEGLLNQITFVGEQREYGEQSTFFYERYQEHAAAEKLLSDFAEHGQSMSMVIRGEFGSGKTVLQNQLLERAAGQFAVFEANCYQGESKWPLRPWNRILKSIEPLVCGDAQMSPRWHKLMSEVFPDFDHSLPDGKYVAARQDLPLDRLAHIITESLIKLSRRKQILLSFEDIHWMDAESVQVLTAVLLDLPPCCAMMIATAGDERNWPLEDMLSELQGRGKLMILPLQRFSIEICHRFMEKALSGKTIEGDLLQRIYTETEGNPFFLNEYVGILSRNADIDTMTPSMLKALKARFLYLSSEQLELLQLVSYFDDGAPADLLLALTGRDEEDLYRDLKLLEDRALLTEHGDAQGGTVSFTHVKLREYTYMSQLAIRKKMIHGRIAQRLEESYVIGDIKRNTQLVHHFTQAGNICKAMRYRIATLERILNFNHEMFPTLDEIGHDPAENAYISRGHVSDIFAALEEGFMRMKRSPGSTAEYDQLWLEFSYIRGRYHIREGNYKEGAEDISFVIEKAKQINDAWHELESYKQMFLLYLQIYDLKKMDKYWRLGLELAVKCNYYDQIGIILRLKGLYYQMTGDFEQAESALNRSIAQLAITPELARKYCTNIAAAHNYIGEIRQAEGNYAAAMKIFQKAISLCLWCSASSSLSYFYINAGKNAYIMGKFKIAKGYFEKAYSLYGEFDSFWRRPVLDSYMALTMMTEEDFPKVLHYLTSAQESTRYINDPGELGTVYFAQALIQRQVEQRPELQGIFSEVLIYPAHKYYRLSLTKLNKDYNRFEISQLRQKFK